MHGQTNEAWALYKSNPSRMFWGDLSREQYIACPKLAFLAGNTFCSRAIVHLRKLQLEADGSTGALIDPKPAQFFFAQIESSR